MSGDDPDETPEPIRVSAALIRKIDDQKTRWLAVWNPEQNYWEFVIAQRLENESGIVAVSREVSWRLNLDRAKDFIVSKMAMLHVSLTSGEPDNPFDQEALVNFIPIEIYRDGVLEKLRENKDVVWLSSFEVFEGKTKNGQLFDPLLCRWNRRWKIIQPWVP